MDNYHHKYLKYKCKYLNLLEKINNLKGFGPNDLSTQNQPSASGDLRYAMNPNEPINQRDLKLSSLFNIFITEPIYVLNPNPMNSISLNDDNDFEGEKPTKKMKKEQTHDYNLRGVQYQKKKETSDFYIGSYTQEIVKNLKLNGLSEQTIKKLKNNFSSDDIAEINRLNNDDTEYIHFDNYGKNIECWIADNMCCPCCGEKSLRRFVKDNMPCIDLICSNPFHNFEDGVKFFQVKSKSSEVLNPEYKNFDYETKQIHTGSKSIGQYIHSIEKYDEYYSLLIGYICIEYTKINNNHNEMIQILSSSFILLPKIDIVKPNNLFKDDTDIPDIPIKYNDKLKLEKTIVVPTLQSDTKYYWYIDFNPLKNIIEFSTINNDIVFLNRQNANKLFENNFPMEFITTNYNPKSRTKWISMNNPFDK